MTAKPYDVIGLGIVSHDFIGVAASEPLLGVKQPLANWIEAGGGPVATALVTVARLGGHCCMLSAVGDDGYGERIIDELRREGVSPAGVVVRPGGSHIAFVLAEPGRDRRSVWWHNDRAVLDNLTLDRDLVLSGRALLIDSHMGQAGLQAAQWARAAGIPVMLDAERVKEGTFDLLPLIDWIVVSERFGRESTGESAAAAAAAALHARYGSMVVITCGSAGSWCAIPGDQFHTASFTVDPVDTTGCGDVFHGALLFALLRGDPIRAALRFASATAALKTRAFGGRAGIPTLAEIEALCST